MKIYDCFQFFNEIDLLEIRLKNLYDTVDYFVIVESTKTHSGADKKSFYLENKSLFSEYNDKIIHVLESFPDDMNNVLDSKRNTGNKYDEKYNEILEIFNNNESYLKNEPSFARDYFQRDFIKLGLLNCDDDDIILVSDLDEIPKREVINNVRNELLLNKVLLMDCHNYFINNLAHTNWYGTFTIKYSDISKNGLSRLRERSSKSFDRIPDAGWHLSFVGGEERVKTKISNYAHQEFNNNFVIESVGSKIDSNVDIFGRSNTTYQNDEQEFFFDSLKSVDINDYNYPQDILELIKEKYSYLIK
jgi:beta-1,4-mannosyl-glycoprotein beta-1,4-N-acetylglucosaminyltransferase